MTTRAVPRSVYLTMFTGVSVLMAVYLAARSGDWDEARRVTLLLGFLAVAGVVYFADWYMHRRRARD